MNIEKLKSLLDNDDKLVARFLGIFKTEIPKQLSELSGAIENKDWEKASAIAHGIKSQAKYLGLQEIAATAYRIEENAEKEAGLESLPNYLLELEAALLEVVNSL